MSPDDRIDDLYQLPLADFTAARNALAKTLSGPSAKDDAKRIRALQKPTLVAWAANLLYWRARKTFDRLLDRGARLRKAQIAALSGKGDADALREATDVHRAAIAEAVREASRLGAVGPQHAEPLTRTLEALSLAVEPPEPYGRLTDALKPAGFEALTGITPQARPPKAPSKPSPASDAETKKREAEAKKRQAEIQNAEAVVERARAAEALARQALDRATRERRDAEVRLSKLQ